MRRQDVFQFGGFMLEVGERRLPRGTEAVPLSPKAYVVLVALVREPGRLMTKDELLARVWAERLRRGEHPDRPRGEPSRDAAIALWPR